MCMIIVKKRGVDLPPKELLRETFMENPDGSGFVYWRNGVNHLRKGYFKVEEWINAIYSEVKKDDLLITHSRIMTSGLKDEENTQPFIISNDFEEIIQVRADTRKPVLAHNGIIADFGGKRYSDTVEFIQGILSDKKVIGNLKSPAIRTLIERSISSSRFAIIKDGELYLLGDWHKDEKYKGLLFSHARYSYTYYPYSGYSSWLYNPANGEKDAKNEEEEILWKEFLNLNPRWGKCSWCDDDAQVVPIDGMFLCWGCFKLYILEGDDPFYNYE